MKRPQRAPRLDAYTEAVNRIAAERYRRVPNRASFSTAPATEDQLAAFDAEWCAFAGYESPTGGRARRVETCCTATKTGHNERRPNVTGNVVPPCFHALTDATDSFVGQKGQQR